MTASPPETRSNSSFATLLASLASSPNASSPGWDDAALAEDVATLSYEKALKTHSRRSGYPVQRLTDPENSTGNSIQGLEQEPRPSTNETAAQSQLLPLNSSRRSDERAHRKSASVTIRLGELENEQLHARAAEAGLSVSAYLRSCIFEVEELRSQVKQTLADMRRSTAQNQDSSLRTVPHPSRGWRERILPGWTRHRGAAAD
jgi:predicted DNA binding CopG/RHH family protein